MRRWVRAAMGGLIVLLCPHIAHAQGTLAPAFYQQFLDTAGVSLSGAKLYSYLAGTSTPEPVYTDSTIAVAHANPAVADSAGRLTFWLNPAKSYKFILKTSADVTIVTTDNVGAVPPSTVNVDVTGTAGEALAANDVVYLSDGSGATTAGRWYKADADFTYASTAAGAIGMVPSAIASATTGSIRIQGRVTGLAGLTAGAPYYVSATAGGLTGTAPALRRFVGTADGATSLVLSPIEVDAVVRAASQTALDFVYALNGAQLGRVAAVAHGVPRVNAAGSAWEFAELDTDCQGRLTLETGVPVSTADQLAKTTVYFTPYSGDRCALYDGSAKWISYTFTERSVAVPATTNTNYDLFLYDSAGTLTLDATAWTNDTTRATALATQNGRYVKTGATARRYLGTFRTTGVSGQTEDSDAKRFVWNYFNRVRRRVRIVDTTDSWTYTTATWRQANASTANQIAVVNGVAEEWVDLRVQALSNNAGSVTRAVSIGQDSTSAPATGAMPGGTDNAGQITQHVASLIIAPAIGYHFYAWLEYSVATGTTTWYGDNALVDVYLSGLFGLWAC